MPYKDQERAKEWAREYARRRYAADPAYRRRRAAWSARTRSVRVAELRAVVNGIKSHPCSDCGQTFDPVCMDFDHRPGELKRDCVAKLLSTIASVEAVMQEIAKCDLVCSNCHRLRTKKRKTR
jgi:hypothetical protein